MTQRAQLDVVMNSSSWCAPTRVFAVSSIFCGGAVWYVAVSELYCLLRELGVLSVREFYCGARRQHVVVEG